MSFQLPHVISWSHRLAEEVLSPGDMAVDLTAGRGRDTLMLLRRVGDAGCVLAFDIQAAALTATRTLLESEGCPVEDCRSAPLPTDVRGAWLVQADHRDLSRYLSRPPRVIIANLGYLPGGDREVITRPESTVASLHAALERLLPGGRLVCVLYTAHPGGREEAEEVERLLGALPSREWFVLKLQVVNRDQAPYLLVAERRRQSGSLPDCPEKTRVCGIV